jgi:hypothetical protein
MSWAARAAGARASGSPSTANPPAIATASIAAIIAVTTASGRPRCSARWKHRKPAAVAGAPATSATATKAGERGSSASTAMARLVTP